MAAATPRALTLSVVTGAIGVVLVLVGAVTGTNSLSLAGVALGAVSLSAALYWRGELIAAWREGKTRG